MAEGKLRDMGRGRFGSAHRTTASVLLAMSCVVPDRNSIPDIPPVFGPRSALYNREAVSGGPTNQRAGETPPGTSSVFLLSPPLKPTSRGAVPWPRPGGLSSMPVPLGCENLGFDVGLEVSRKRAWCCDDKLNLRDGASAG